jgi:hypothetical protein
MASLLRVDAIEEAASEAVLGGRASCDRLSSVVLAPYASDQARSWWPPDSGKAPATISNSKLFHTRPAAAQMPPIRCLVCEQRHALLMVCGTQGFLVWPILGRVHIQSTTKHAFTTLPHDDTHPEERDCESGSKEIYYYHTCNIIILE